MEERRQPLRHDTRDTLPSSKEPTTMPDCHVELSLDHVDCALSAKRAMQCRQPCAKRLQAKGKHGCPQPVREASSACAPSRALRRRRVQILQAHSTMKQSRVLRGEVQAQRARSEMPPSRVLRGQGSKLGEHVLNRVLRRRGEQTQRARFTMPPKRVFRRRRERARR